MEIKLWRAVVQYFAPIFPADENGKGRRGEGEGGRVTRRNEVDEEEEECRGENRGKKAQAAIMKRQETIIIAP